MEAGEAVWLPPRWRAVNRLMICLHPELFLAVSSLRAGEGGPE